MVISRQKLKEDQKSKCFISISQYKAIVNSVKKPPLQLNHCHIANSTSIKRKTLNYGLSQFSSSVCGSSPLRDHLFEFDCKLFKLFFFGNPWAKWKGLVVSPWEYIVFTLWSQRMADEETSLMKLMRLYFQEIFLNSGYITL